MKKKFPNTQRKCCIFQDGDNLMVEAVEETNEQITFMKRIDTEAYKENTKIVMKKDNPEALRNTAKFLVRNVGLTQAKTGNRLKRSQGWVSLVINDRL